MKSDFIIRSARTEDAEACGRILHDAFGGISRRHGFESDFPDPAMSLGLMRMVIDHPNVFSAVAEHEGRIVGSNFLWESPTVAGVGPITIDPAGQGHSVGRRLMQAVLHRAAEQKIPAVRLVQAAFNVTSMSLYTKLGFDIREPLVCLQGPPIRHDVPGYQVRAATDADVPACNDICRRVHGHDREIELRGAIERGTARVVLRGGQVCGYCTEIGFLAHAVALENPGLMALIAAAEQFTGPGFLLPSRNSEVFRWCLANGLRITQPMSLMSMGLYNEPRGAWLPSVLY